MFQVRLTAALFVCASLYSQQVPYFDRLSHGDPENATNLEIAAKATEEGDERHLFTVAPIEPESISFSEVEEGSYVAFLRIDARALKAARVHFPSFALPEGAEVYVHSDEPGQSSRVVAGPYRVNGPVDGEFWSDAVPGGAVVIEFRVRGEVPAILPFKIDLVEEVAEWHRAPAEPAAITESFKRRSMFRGVEVDHDVVDGEGVLEGDILLGNVNELAEALPDTGKDRSKSAIGLTATTYRWPNGVIPYVIDSSISYAANVQTAINHWNTTLPGVIRLVPRTSEKDYVRFINGSGCSSYIGRIGGVQNITLTGSCGVGNIVHEIGHAVGLYHEQSREDRNTWVTINTANVPASSMSNFKQYPSSSDDLVYYAYNSIMHYHATAFTANGQNTIETIPAGIPIGQRNGLDISDIAAVRRMYNKQTTAVSISTVPAGLPITVDGVSVVTPATFNWPAGSVHTIAASTLATVTTAAPSRYKFVRWSDNGGLSHTITVPATGLAVAATYAIEHKLAASVATASAGTVNASPASGDAYYAQGKSVNITATPASGYCFSGWSGLTGGTANETTVAMSRSLAPSAKFIVGAITPAAPSATIPAAGGTFTMNTSASTGCGWSVKSSVPWITVSKAYATSSSPSFTYAVQPNTSGVARAGLIRIDSKYVAITQAK